MAGTGRTNARSESMATHYGYGFLHYDYTCTCSRAKAQIICIPLVQPCESLIISAPFSATI